MAKVVIVNKLAQTVSVGVRDPQGTIREIKIPGAGKSEEVDDTALTPQTRNMINAGHLRLRVISA